MGVLNVTPDSFSDGGTYLQTEAAITAGLAMAKAGADIIDIGGESTRPGAPPTDPEQERARVIPVVRALAAAGLTLSIDTRHAATMAAALNAGARIVNDISALAHDPQSALLVAARGCPVILMHMRGEPATMQAHATYTDAVAEVASELAAHVSAAEQAGIHRKQIALDPGIGFAKRAEHSQELLRRLPELTRLGFPLLVGVSRKAFIGRLSGVATPRERLAGSLAAGLFAISRGASILRVHDVAETIQALRTWQALAST
ncbi:MAG TPA: dihydropteroate synthase [Acetobacteraceae bacterium]|nr:dihydropteroate synthase [Acetobacteraceae bacterium]